MAHKNRGKSRPAKSSSLGTVRISTVPSKLPGLPQTRRRRSAEPSLPGLEPSRTSWFSPQAVGMVDVSPPVQPIEPPASPPLASERPVAVPVVWEQQEAPVAPQERPVREITLADLPSVSWKLITPEIATEYLKNQRRNRVIRRPHMERLKRAILNGNWQPTGEGIHRDKEGRLGNGQHRLTAIIEAGVPVYLLVVENVSDEAMAMIDQGRVRSFVDHMKIEGHTTYATEISSTCRLIWNYEHGMINPTGGGTKVMLGHDDLDEVRRRYPEIEESARFIAATGVWRLGPRTACVFTYTIMARIDKAAADEFFTSLAAPSGMNVDNPILVLHTKLTNMMAGTAGKLSKTPRSEPTAALIIKTWNAWRTGKPIKRVNWAPPEPFPRPT